jgi:hypothetical protein
MIRYPIEPQVLIDRIAQHKPTWLGRAEQRTQQYLQAQTYTGGAEFWGEIKDVYIDLQHEKCAYCETWLQGKAHASKVHEVEHFRPKSKVRAWPNRKKPAWRDFPPDIATGAGHDTGYFALAYHPFNYAIACTRCNSSLKSDHFPVRGARQPSLLDPSTAHAEDALLVYPISHIDDDPRTLICFEGVLAVPVHASGPQHERALTIIWFFDLNHQDLTTRRAGRIFNLWAALETRRLADTETRRKLAQRVIAKHLGPSAEFSSCLSDFAQLYANQRDRADEVAELASRLIPGTED